MLALHRCERPGDALALYSRTSALLASELGLDPGRALRELQQQILSDDPVLTGPPPARFPAWPAVPRQVPAAVGNFTGRGDELVALTGLLDHDAAGVCVISGTAGVGKTALAVCFAHQVAAHFPDGQLYVNLRGFGPAQTPMTAAEAVRVFLEAFEVPPERIPASLDAQAGLYRSLLADRRALVLLDNARDSRQVRPLIPGGAGCLTVITSREPLTSLVATEGARPLALDLLTDDEVGALLSGRIGAGRVAAEPKAAREIIASCARLPLALSIVASRAASYRHRTLARLADELRGYPISVLDAGDGDDDATSIRTVFSWSYRQLSGAAARLFRLLGLHPGPDVTGPAIASLAGLPLAAAVPLLAELLRANLISEPVPGRFLCHDLLRAYAGELASASELATTRQAAIARLLDHYLHTAAAAERLVTPNPVHQRISLPPPCGGAVPEQLESEAAAQAWLTAEHRVLFAAIGQASATGHYRHAWQLPWMLKAHLARRGRWHDLAAAQRTGLEAAQRHGDREGQAHAHSGIGGACAYLGEFDAARDHLGQALALFTELGDLAGQADTHRHMGAALVPQRRLTEALYHAQRALQLYQATANRSGQATSLNNIGWAHAQTGRYDEALVHCEQALELQRELGAKVSEAYTLDSVGYAHFHLGHYPQAIDCYQQAIGLHQELDNRYHRAVVLGHLGDTYLVLGDRAAARTAWQRALSILRQLGHGDAEQVSAKLAVLAELGEPG